MARLSRPRPARSPPRGRHGLQFRVSALPAAGATALQAVRRLGSVLGHRVLVTGASGGVGRLAVQLAARAGTHVIASVGRPERAAALCIGWASREPTVIDFEEQRLTGIPKRLEPFMVSGTFGPDIAYLIHLLENAELDPQVGWRGPWTQVDEAIEAFLARRIPGKAVLDLTPRKPDDSAGCVHQSHA